MYPQPIAAFLLSVAVPLQFGLQLVVVPAVAVAGLRHGSMRS